MFFSYYIDYKCKNELKKIIIPREKNLARLARRKILGPASVAIAKRLQISEKYMVPSNATVLNGK